MFLLFFYCCSQTRLALNETLLTVDYIVIKRYELIWSVKSSYFLMIIIISQSVLSINRAAVTGSASGIRGFRINLSPSWKPIPRAAVYSQFEVWHFSVSSPLHLSARVKTSWGVKDDSRPGKEHSCAAITSEMLFLEHGGHLTGDIPGSLDWHGLSFWNQGMTAVKAWQTQT